MIELRGKKAIVTGGAMGIGLATCRRLVKVLFEKKILAEEQATKIVSLMFK